MPDKAAAFDRLTAGGTKLRQREIEHTAQGRMGGAGNALEWSGRILLSDNMEVPRYRSRQQLSSGQLGDTCCGT